ncbi:MAG: AAA family ATPase [Bacillota bacterium]
MNNDRDELPLSIASKRDDVRKWLAGLAPWRCDDRACWLEAGMVLQWWSAQLARIGYDLSDELLDLWVDWSSQSTKFVPGECERQWEGFDASRPNPAKLGTLAAWYKEDQQAPDSASTELQAAQDQAEDYGERIKTLNADEVKALSAKLKITKSAKLVVTPTKPTKPAAIMTKPPRHTPGVGTLDAMIAATAKKLGAVKTTPYPYPERPDGSLLCPVRFDLPDGGKAFCQFSRGADGQWRRGGLDGPSPLYDLPKIKAADKSVPIFVVEGEKCAGAGTEIGLLTTTTAGGAQSPGKSDLTPLAGRTIYLLPDADEPGEAYSRKLQQLFAELNPQPKVKVIRLPGLPAKGDLYDFVQIRKAEGKTPEQTKAEILSLAASAELVDLLDFRGRPLLRRASDVEYQPIRWLWPGFIALGKLALLASDPGCGKSTLSCDLAARISRGMPWPDAPNSPNESGSVLMLNVEDDASDTVRPRLEAAGADLSKITILEGVRRHDKNGKTRDEMFCLEQHLPALESAIRQTSECRLIVLDPLGAIMGRTDGNKNEEVRGLLAPLAALAARYGVAILGITHLNKSSGGSVAYRVLGSIGFTAAARCVFGVARDRQDPTRRLFVPLKSNIAVDTHTLAYKLEESSIPGIARLRWESVPVDIRPEDAFGDAANSTPTKTDQAGEWLREALAEGEVPSEEVFRKGRRDGFAVSAIRRAAEALGVRARKRGFQGPWVWRLPAGDGNDTDQDASPKAD